jgi:hypothetical protein
MIMTSVTRYLRRMLSPPYFSGLTDTQLLERFVSERDEAAFEILMWRHGPKVLGVCRRILRQEQDAEAFQATSRYLAWQWTQDAPAFWKTCSTIALSASRCSLTRRKTSSSALAFFSASANHPLGIAKDGRGLLDTAQVQDRGRNRQESQVGQNEQGATHVVEPARTITDDKIVLPGQFLDLTKAFFWAGSGPNCHASLRFNDPL